MATTESLVQRIRGEYNEMPGLCLTFAQACRLWQMDATTCQRVLDTLLAEGFLARGKNGSFIASPAETPRPSPIEAALRPPVPHRGLRRSA